jgi:hypothetical protein
MCAAGELTTSACDGAGACLPAMMTCASGMCNAAGDACEPETSAN